MSPSSWAEIIISEAERDSAAQPRPTGPSGGPRLLLRHFWEGGSPLPPLPPRPRVERAKFSLNSRMLLGLITMMQINIYYVIIHLCNC